MKDSSLHKEPPLRILLVESDPAQLCMFQVARAALGSVSCHLAHANRLEAAFRNTRPDSYDVILVDFRGSAALLVKTLLALRHKAPGIPIVLLTEGGSASGMQLAGETHVPAASKGSVNGDLLARAIRHAVERRRFQDSLPRLAFLDELTGLCNRRGFFLLAEHQLQLARRNRRNLLLLFMDLDGLKQINDTFGHREGDLALTRTAAILCTTFRGSDVVGRLGGDEFGVLTWEDSEQSAGAVVTRLLRNVQRCNAEASCRHVLSLSLGIARFDPAGLSTVEELMARADKALYEQKRGKRLAPGPAPVTSGQPAPRSVEARPRN
jgi:diguanylate cyclase (GGDEF)-like protein